MNDTDIKEIYEKYGFLIYGRCLRILRCEDEAKDAMHSVFVKLMENISAIRSSERIVPWIFTAAKNHCFNILRSRKRFSNDVDIDELSCGKLLDERMSARDLVAVIMRCHGSKVRDAVYYTFVEQMDQREIRKITGQSPATVRRNLKKFKDSLPHIKKRLGI